MNRTMETTVLRRLSMRRRVLLSAYAVTVAAYLAAIVWVLFDLTISLWIVNFTTIFYFCVVRTLDHRYNRAFAKANLAWGCGSQMSELQVLDKGNVTRAELARQGLLPTKEDGSGVVCGLAMTGQSAGMPFRVSELTSYYNLPAGAAHKVGLLNGVWLEAELSQDSGLHLSLIAKDVIDPARCPSFYLHQGLHQVPILEAPLKSGYLLFSDDSGVRESGHFQRQCRQLAAQASKSGSQLLVSIHGRRICAFLSRRSLIRSIPIQESVTEEILQWDPLPELAMLLELGRHWTRMAPQSPPSLSSAASKR